MSSCTKIPIQDCDQDSSCGAGYECCFHKHLDYKSKTYCVQEGTCNRNTGICKERNPSSGVNRIEKFTVFSREGYNDCDCKWKDIGLILLIITVILVAYLCMKHV